MAVCYSPFPPARCSRAPLGCIEPWAVMVICFDHETLPRKGPTNAIGWLAPAAVWLGVGLVAGLLSYDPQVEARGEFVLWNLACWLLWIPLTPYIVSMAGRAPIERGQLAPSLIKHALVFACVAIGHALWSAAVGKVIVSSPAVDIELVGLAERMLLASLIADLLAYGALVAVGMAVEYQRRWHEGQDEATKLAEKLSRAQLEALKMQLHPHFLFNTLHAVGVLVRKRDTRGALRMLIGLSDLLRITLDNAGKQVVPLRQELGFLQRYLRVEQVRFGDRLEVDQHIDSNVLGAMVPNLALQPLVENAIRHGIAPRDAPGAIKLTAEQKGEDRLRLEVADDGVGLAEDSAELSGMGLANVRARLAQLYGDAHHFEISDRKDRPGVVAIIEIPLEFADESKGK